MNTKLYHNERAVAALQSFAAGGRFPHALLVEGPAGSGKKTFARLFAMAALCQAPQAPCGVCSACVKADRGVHPDILFFAPAEGKKEFTVDLVRELRQDAYIAPNEGSCKVYILDRAHTMNTAAQNALLKILEEPPPFVRLVLLCENRSRMLPTILSRTTAVALQTPTPEQCVQTLALLRPDKEEALRLAAAAGAGGNIGKALELLETAKPSKAAADAARLRETLLLGSRYDSLRVLAGYEKDREGFGRMLELLRENILSLAAAKCGKAGSGELEPFLNRVTVGQVLNAGEAVEKAARRNERNASIPLTGAGMVEEIKRALEKP